ncbi:MAG: acyl-CoA dehydrogenase family protein [Polyangiaceae bacterium]|nr:acyl-CoA dehydrogenase family protein [Polyangiaceae bacterium]
MANYFSDNPDLQYYFDRGVDWRRLAELVEQGFRLPDGHASAEEALEFYREVASVVGEVAATVIEPRAAAIDAQGMQLSGGEVVAPPEHDEIFSQLGELGLHGLVIPRELGGQNAPALLYFMNGELLSRADTSVMTHHGFHGGIAMVLYLLSLAEGTTRFDPETGLVTETRFPEEMAEVARGEAWGCMDITEPDAGSDMAALSAYAEQDEDGRWYVTGQKIFITSGHGKYHFVIARTDRDPKSGLGGLGMFLVRAYEDEASGRRRVVTIDRLEEKLGHHGSATASLSFERAPAELIGAPGEGFRYMLVLMNNARVSVGFESLGLMEAAYRRAAEYAAGRVSMGKTIDRHEMIADALDEMRTDIQALRALAVSAALHEELATRLGRIAQLTTKDEVEQQRLRREGQQHQREARRLTPLLKYLAAEKAVEHARRAMQIHGGNGYIVEYGVERLLRDALVLPIYEGTSQIQALMAMRDTLMAIIKSPQDFVRRVAEARWRALSSRDPLARRVARVSLLVRGAEQHLVARTAGAKFRELVSRPVSEWSSALSSGWDPKRDFRFAMLHAERLCHLLADEAILEILLEQAQRHPERAELLERALERAEPRMRSLHDVITTTGARLIEQLSDTEDLDPGVAATA